MELNLDLLVPLLLFIATTVAVIGCKKTKDLRTNSQKGLDPKGKPLSARALKLRDERYERAKIAKYHEELIDQFRTIDSNNDVGLEKHERKVLERTNRGQPIDWGEYERDEKLLEEKKEAVRQECKDEGLTLSVFGDGDETHRYEIKLANHKAEKKKKEEEEKRAKEEKAKEAERERQKQLEIVKEIEEGIQPQKMRDRNDNETVNAVVTDFGATQAVKDPTEAGPGTQTGSKRTTAQIPGETGKKSEKDRDSKKSNKEDKTGRDKKNETGTGTKSYH